jgi:putative CocE/NonD family hydrolase
VPLSLRCRTIAALVVLVCVAGPAWSAAPEARRLEGVHESGAHWAIDMPAHWNGTLLLYARGYRPTAPLAPPATAPRDMGEELLAQGYALAASNYSGDGWALEEAPRDQVRVLQEFTARFGAPKRAIAWGDSMGGLVTVALAERDDLRIDGALSVCGSTGGALGMLNTALDGAFAFRSLLAPASDIRLVGIDDDPANARRVLAVLEQARQSPEGRARIALAATLAQIPPWTDPAAAAPGAEETVRQVEELAKAVVAGIFLPRVDQERRAGGITSWNVGVDYRAQLRASGREPFVQARYREAGLDLEADLAALAAAPRIQADAAAVAYLRAHYVPTGRLRVPVLTLHEVGDGMTIASNARALEDLAAQAGTSDRLGQLFVQGAGHCRFTPAERSAALRSLEERIETGRWRLTPADVARRTGDAAGTARFVRHRPASLLRHCGATAGSCAGEPAVAGARYDASQRSSQYVTVRDGTRLAVAVFRPVSAGTPESSPLPVILVHALGQRPRDLDGRITADLGLGELVRRGYVVAWMEPRGFGASFGASTPFLTRQNGRDAADVIEWLARQPWANGKVAMYGLSNLGYIQWLTAAERPAGLIAIAPSVANPDLYYQLYPNGVTALAGAPLRAGQGPPGEPVDDDVAPHPLAQAAHEEHRANQTLRDLWLPHFARDQVNPLLGYAPGITESVMPERIEDVRAAGVQVFQHAGWHDASPRGQLLAWKAFGGRITLGAWRHGLFARTEGGALIREELFAWFDEVLKGSVRRQSPPVRYETINRMGEPVWNWAAEWPLPGQVSTRYFIAPGTHSLTQSPPAAAAADAYRVDAEVAAFDGNFNRLNRSWGGDMTTGIDQRGLSYTSAPLAADTEVTGHPVASLWLSADARDVDLVAWLSEVDAEGRSRYVTDGAMRASHRALAQVPPWSELGLPYHPSTRDALQPLPPGEPVPVTFDLHPVSYLFHAGSRIRLTITGGERNAYEQPEGFDAAAPPTLRIHSGPAQPSTLSLPVIPPGSQYFVGRASSGGVESAAELYVGANQAWLRYGDNWHACERRGRTCVGDSGPLRLSLRVDRSGLRHATLSGPVTFEGSAP